MKAPKYPSDLPATKPWHSTGNVHHYVEPAPVAVDDLLEQQNAFVCKQECYDLVRAKGARRE